MYEIIALGYPTTANIPQTCCTNEIKRTSQQTITMIIEIMQKLDKPRRDQ